MSNSRRQLMQGGRDSAVSWQLPPTRALKIVVAGEVLLDRYIWGDVERISPEAPIPVLRVHRREEKPGNAGFVMANLRALGAQVAAFSVVGNDRNGAMLRTMFHDLAIDTRGLLVDSERPTIVKERMFGSVQSANCATQQLLRVDDEDRTPLSSACERELAARLERVLKPADGLLVSDINKGLLSRALLRRLIDAARRRNIPIVIDPRLGTDYSIYRGATALTPNRFETETATGIRLIDRQAWRSAARALVRRLGLRACLVTLDRDGMYLAERGGRSSFITTAPREVYDVSGAGDVVLAVFGLLVIAGLSFAAAAGLANIAAGLEVGRLGTEIISRDDLARALTPINNGFERKIVSLNELQAELRARRRAGQRIVFTNGCFDLLHAGHLQLLSFAHAQGDLLIVGINSDRAVRLIKGNERPVYPAVERARLLAGFELVDYVVVFDDERAERIIDQLRPDVLVKGADWRGRPVDGRHTVESYGGQVMLAPLLEGHSTTATISRVRQHERATAEDPAAVPEKAVARNYRRSRVSRRAKT